MANAASFTALQTPFLDANGKVSWTWLKLFQQWQSQLGTGFDQNGNLIGNISTSVSIVGRNGTLGSILSQISDSGVISPDGMTAATSAKQGAVYLAAGIGSNRLGSAASADVNAFDSAGSAAAAQVFATAAANGAQAAAESFASDADNLTSGTVDNARLGGISITITTAKLTVTGANGSMTFQNGLLTSEVAAT